MPKSVHTFDAFKPNNAKPTRKLDVSDSAVGFGNFDATTTAVFWMIEGTDLRVRWDGQDPTATTGFLFEDGASGTWSVAKAKAAKFIRDGSTDGVVWYAEELTGT